MSSTYSTGASGAGALTQILAQGALDSYLSQNAQFTYWKERYNKHTAFAMEAIAQPFTGATSFGAESHITLNRSGDLVYFMYVIIDLPGIEASEISGGSAPSVFPAFDDSSCTPCQKTDDAVFAQKLSAAEADGMSQASETTKKDLLKHGKNKWLKQHHHQASSLECCEELDDSPDTLCPELEGCWAHWTNNIGQHLIRQARILIGGSTIDTLYSEFLFMYEELCGRAGRRLTEMVGKRFTRTQLICDSRQRRHLYIPLPFWFTMNSGSALALSALQFHGVQVHIEFATLASSIVVSGPNVCVKNTKTGAPIVDNDLKAMLETTYVFLENAERDRFATTSFEQLITQTQVSLTHTTNSMPRIPLNFNHPCIELIFAVRRKCHAKTNNWFNFSGLAGKDPLVSATLSLNNQSRFAPKPGTWFRLVQPYQHHSNIPDAFIYVYSFALHPESSSPSGSCNLSRIDHVDLSLTLQEDLGSEQATVIVYARNWNILRFRDGLAGLAFAT